MTINPLFLTEAVKYDEEMTIADAIPFGLQTVLLGIGVVFAVLIILWAVLSVFKFVFYKKPDGEADKTAVEKKAPAPAPAPEPVPAPVVSEPSDDAELVAVITAAIAAMMDAPQTSFRVVSFRRTARK